MNSNITIIAAASLVTIGAVALYQMGYCPLSRDTRTHSQTDFIEPSAEFIACDFSADCIKIKGSSCPPTEGGVEVCINKNHFILDMI